MCCASAALPPLPPVRSLRPSRNAAPIAAAACSTAGAFCSLALSSVSADCLMRSEARSTPASPAYGRSLLRSEDTVDGFGQGRTDEMRRSSPVLDGVGRADEDGSDAGA